MIRQYPAFLDDHAWAMPVIGETYDGLASDICGMHVTEKHVLQALDSASDGPVAEGNVGGGTGMMTYEFKGGTGSASRLVRIRDTEYAVGVLVQSNFGSRKDLTILGVPVGREWPEDAPLTQLQHPETGSSSSLSAPTCPCCRSSCGAWRTRRAGHCQDRLPRRALLRRYHAGVFQWPMTTDCPDLAIRNTCCLPDRAYKRPLFRRYYDAVVQSVEEAIINAMLAAETLPLVKPPGYAFKAIDHQRLLRLMRIYGRLD